MWNVAQYGLYADERKQPFFDLLSRVSLPEVSLAADLGCGSGELTATLLQRWPGARVVGVDSSPEMLAAAAAHAIPQHLSFELGDLGSWAPPEPVDLIVANASIHWVPAHEVLLPRLVNGLRPGGVLAFQVPANFSSPSHELIQTLCAAEKWAPKLGFMSERKAPVQEPAWYLAYLTNLGLSAQVWETTYLHLLQGEDPVLEWVAGSALRPVLQALVPSEQSEFRRELGAALREAYPSQAIGTIFPFRRIFAVARK